MQNMGIEVLFKGINSLRLWQGLWVTIRIALISMVFSIIQIGRASCRERV